MYVICSRPAANQRGGAAGGLSASWRAEGDTVEYLRVPFEPAEFEALSRLAERNLRPVSNEVRYIVRQALRQARLLPTEDGAAGEGVW